MNDKYYTPSIEEFHVGFKYELKDEYISEPQRLIDWYSQTINSVQELESVEFEMQRNSVRVKYLDSEDIESLGFEHDQTTKDGACFYLGTIIDENQWCLTAHNATPSKGSDYTSIDIFDANKKSDRCFNGVIKNKSELISELKRLNITK